MSETKFCPKCGKNLVEKNNFYTYKNGEKVKFCKACQTMHIDNYDPKTFIHLLKDMDVPYIETEWNVLRDKAAKKANETHKSLTGMSVFGKYLSKMKLKQWADFGWEDTERLQAERAMRTQEAYDNGDIQTKEALQEQLEAGEITQEQYDSLVIEEAPVESFNPYPVNAAVAGYEVVPRIDIAADLTEEDKLFLAMKWGYLYRPDQWVVMEKFYNEMLESFDIQGAAREDTLKMICKTSLRLNEAIDCGDFDGYKKLAGPYDAMMKAAKFTEAQNKEDGKGFVNSVGELVAMCEKEGGFIPRLETEIPRDIVDKTLQDMNNYTYNLVTKDLGLGQQIEDYIKKLKIQKIQQEEDELNDEISIDEIEKIVLEDADFLDYYEEIESQRQEDLEGESDGA